jgi:hypothetical protein
MRKPTLYKSGLVLFGLAAAAAAVAANPAGIFSVLKSLTPLGKQPSGIYLLPTNQLLRPWGVESLIEGRPVDMTFDPQKRILAVLNTRSVLLLDGSTGTKVAEIPAKSTSYTGIAFRPGARELWASETTRTGPDSILIAELSETGMPGKIARIDLPGHPCPRASPSHATAARPTWPSAAATPWRRSTLARAPSAGRLTSASRPSAWWSRRSTARFT